MMASSPECEKWAKVIKSQEYLDITAFWEWFSEFVYAVGSDAHLLKHVRLPEVFLCMPDLTVKDTEHVTKFVAWLLEPEGSEWLSIAEIHIDRRIEERFNIDVKKLETERRALLEHQQALNEES